MPSDENVEGPEQGPLAKLLDLLQDEPLLLYGIGSVVVLTALVGAGVSGNPTLVVAVAGALLLAALAAGTYVIVRRGSSATRGGAHVADVVREPSTGVDLDTQGKIVTKPGARVGNVGGAGGGAVRIRSTRGIKAGRGSSIGNIESRRPDARSGRDD
jgi:hypothetical protein